MIRARALRAGALVAALFITALVLVPLSRRVADGLPRMPWSTVR